jgi:uncharacterized protein (DUF305 family)
MAATVGGFVLVVAMAAVAVAGTAGERPGNAPGSRMHGSAVGSEFGYLAEMVAHHQDAVVAAANLQRSNRPQMRALGASIVKTQSAQIDLMNGWLAKWYPGRITDVDYEPMMRALSGLSGDELDEAFLQDMIGHHMEAVMMSQRFLVGGLAEHARVNGLAESIRDEQGVEIFQMRRWLAEWFDTVWRHRPGSPMETGMMW